MSHLVFPYRNVKRDGGWLSVTHTAIHKSQSILLSDYFIFVILSIQVDLY